MKFRSDKQKGVSFISNPRDLSPQGSLLPDNPVELLTHFLHLDHTACTADTSSPPPNITMTFF